jgi:hypothetical protein
VVAIVGVFAYMNMSSSTPGSNSNAPLTGGGGNLATFCADYNIDTTVGKALLAVDSGINAGEAPIFTKAADLNTAAANATRMANEAPATVNLGGTQVQVQAIVADVAKTLIAAASKMTNGDTSGYTEFTVGVDSSQYGLYTAFRAPLGIICPPR